MKKVFLYLSFTLVLLSSCNGDKIKALNDSIDSLNAVNAELQDSIKEKNEIISSQEEKLNNYRYNADDLEAKAAQYYKDGDLYNLEDVKDKLAQYHPGCEQLKVVESYVSMLDKKQEQARLAEEAQEKANTIGTWTCHSSGYGTWTVTIKKSGSGYVAVSSGSVNMTEDLRKKGNNYYVIGGAAGDYYKVTGSSMRCYDQDGLISDISVY